MTCVNSEFVCVLIFQCIFLLICYFFLREFVSNPKSTINTGTDPEGRLRDAFKMFDEAGTGKLAEE